MSNNTPLTTKKVEDYLHLYLGCECLFKPILRPLSDMTEEEAIVLGYGSKNICILSIENGVVLAEQFRILLSEHFDLFGLIEAGLAIDKTTLNQSHE